MVQAELAQQTKDFDRLRQSAFLVASFIKAKLHKINQRKHWEKERKKEGKEQKIRVAEDTRILPGFTRNAVMGNLGDSPEWLLEHSLLSTSEDGFFAIPNTLFSSENPCILVSNLLARARTLRKGEVIGIISNPAEFLDKAMNLEDLQEKMQCAARSSIIINALHVSSNSQEQPLFDDETWGPKNAELPSDETYKAADLENLTDVGSLPDNLWEQVWNMLRKRVATFRFDG